MHGWEIIQDVAWEGYEEVPKLTMAGYSVMIKEISNQTDQYITHVFLQAGVGGMASGAIAGIAKYFKRVPKIIIVEPKSADCVLQSINAGEMKKIDIKQEYYGWNVMWRSFFSSLENFKTYSKQLYKYYR